MDLILRLDGDERDVEAALYSELQALRRLRRKVAYARVMGFERGVSAIGSILSLPQPKLRGPCPVYLPRPDLQKTPMTSFSVQFILPVDNPVNNVRMCKQGKVVIFEVPVNHPEAHSMGFMDLMAAAELSGLFTVSPPLNNRKISRKELTVVEEKNKIAKG